MSGQTKYHLVNIGSGPNRIDQRVMQSWPDTGHHRVLDQFAVRLSQAGEVSAIWFALTVFAFLVGRFSAAAAIFAVGAIVFEWVFTNRVVKRYVWRARPVPFQPDPRGVRRPSSSSLPSGHSSASMNAAVLVGLMSGWWPFMIPLALLLGGSRFHLRVHYPTDVFVGWLWGAFLAGVGILLGANAFGLLEV
jgi:undecaprenyl-diphosphatase